MPYMKSKLNKIFFFLLLGCWFLGVVLPIQAATDTTMPEIGNPLNTKNFTDIYYRFIQGSLTFIGVTAFLFLIYGGVVWLTSAGNPEKIKTGKNTIVWAIIGVAFVFLSYAILRFIIQIITGVATK